MCCQSVNVLAAGMLAWACTIDCSIAVDEKAAMTQDTVLAMSLLQAVFELASVWLMFS